MQYIQPANQPMKTNRLLVVATTLALSVLAANAAPPPKPPTKTPPKKAQSTQPTIDSVSADSISVKNSKTTETYVIDKNTVIQVDNRSATAGDLRAGMKVEVKASGLEPTHARSITASSK